MKEFRSKVNNMKKKEKQKERIKRIIKQLDHLKSLTSNKIFKIELNGIKKQLEKIISEL